MTVNINQNKKREEFFSSLRKSLVNEVSGLTSKKLESDTLASSFDKYSKTYRPGIAIKRPETFCFYGSCAQYYQRAIDYITNYYPFDGSREDLINFHQNSSVVDLATLKQVWPHSVGHVNFSGAEKVDFFAGPNKIPESEFVGKQKNGETGLNIYPSNGTTIEFWLKKDSFDPALNTRETIVEIGTYPGKLPEAQSGKIKISLLPSSGGSPFRLEYVSGVSSIVEHELGKNVCTDASVGDSKWHHYAFILWVQDENLNTKMYIDGAPVSTSSEALGATINLESFLGGSIGGNMDDNENNLLASLDEFRFFKGKRTTREITRFFDKKIFASDTTNIDYSSRLGVYFRFNKPPVTNMEVDSFVIDHSGHEIFGRIKNYNNSCRVLISALTQSEAGENEESPDPILDPRHPDVSLLVSEFQKIAQSYDSTNQGMLQRFLPQWAREEIENSTPDNPSEFQILLHLMSSEFDDIKLILDSIMVDRVADWQESNQMIDPPESSPDSIEINYSDNIYIGCDDGNFSSYQTNGFKGDRYERQIRAAGLVYQRLAQQASVTENEVEAIQEHLKEEELKSVVINNFEQRLAANLPQILREKGTLSGIERIYNILGQNNTDITDMHLVPEEELFLRDEKIENHISDINSVSFVDNNEGTLFMFSESAQERTNIEGDTNNTSMEYTVEGCFIFPSQETYIFDHKVTSLFGGHEVASATNDLTIQDPDNVNFVVKLEKQSKTSKKAKFIFSSPALLQQDLETNFKSDVYDNSKWSIFVRIRKLSAEPFIEMPQDEYELVFSGYKYLQEHLIDYFEIKSPISKENYLEYKDANKSFFLGAQREDLTGQVITYADSKVLTFSAWDTALSDEDLKIRSRNPLVSGNSYIHTLER